jgi:hypothetical protein
VCCSSNVHVGPRSDREFTPFGRQKSAKWAISVARENGFGIVTIGMKVPDLCRCHRDLSCIHLRVLGPELYSALVSQPSSRLVNDLSFCLVFRAVC